ncbi:hypothetical protein MYP_4080 [Sporocytophaga myxococcoides]|uniref:Uncharacterized protein n=1 Tax=Sporocytophaga myxococcoides TaxID=153721 RepID=A0A098LIT1_9BACT|nr:hypothetical protein MYP_4080 [Sporocytophaga myxococcoides]
MFSSGRLIRFWTKTLKSAESLRFTTKRDLNLHLRGEKKDKCNEQYSHPIFTLKYYLFTIEI